MAKSLNSIIEEVSQELKDNGFKNHYSEAQSIVAFVLKLEKKDLILKAKDKIKKGQLKKINKITKRHLKNWPLPYLFSYQYFYQEKFKVNRKVLIPRPETEIIVEEVLNKTNSNPQKSYTLIDVGTGSACLIISLAKILKSRKINFYATDISRGALKIAKKNAQKHRVRKIISFKRGTLLKPLKKILYRYNKILNDTEEIIILANLPYLTKKEIKKEISLKKEPYRALFGGKDGLSLYRKLFKQINLIKKQKISIYTELNPWQIKKLEKIIKKNLKAKDKLDNKIEIIKDLNRQDRFLKISIN